MPIYEYECTACGKTSEFIEGLSGGGAGKDLHSLRRRLPEAGPVERRYRRMDGIIGDQGGKTCCGREERCGEPPCMSRGAAAGSGG